MNEDGVQRGESKVPEGKAARKRRLHFVSIFFSFLGFTFSHLFMVFECSHVFSEGHGRDTTWQGQQQQELHKPPNTGETSQLRTHDMDAYTEHGFSVVM